jgi:isoleucyl-tRNA synthetase
VHLRPFPLVDEAALDEDLSFAMDEVVKVVHQALALRKSKDLRVRQPLRSLLCVPANERTGAAVQRFAAVIAGELNVKKVEVASTADGLLSFQVKPDFGKLGRRLGKATPLVAKAVAAMDHGLLSAAQAEERPVTVTVDGTDHLVQPDEFTLLAVTPEGLAVSETASAMLALDIDIDDDLRIEGLARDVVRHVQQLRKERDLEMEDRIHLSWDSDDPDLQQALETWSSYIDAETLSLQTTRGVDLDAAKAVKLTGKPLSLDLTKV